MLMVGEAVIKTEKMVGMITSAESLNSALKRKQSCWNADAVLQSEVRIAS